MWAKSILMHNMQQQHERPTTKMRPFTSISEPSIIIDKSITAPSLDNRMRFLQSDHQSSKKLPAAMQAFRALTSWSPHCRNKNAWHNFLSLLLWVLKARWLLSIVLIVITTHIEQCFSIKIIKIILQLTAHTVFMRSCIFVYFRFSPGISNTASFCTSIRL